MLRVKAEVLPRAPLSLPSPTPHLPVAMLAPCRGSSSRAFEHLGSSLGMPSLCFPLGSLLFLLPTLIRCHLAGRPALATNYTCNLPTPRVPSVPILCFVFPQNSAHYLTAHYTLRCLLSQPVSPVRGESPVCSAHCGIPNNSGRHLGTQ